MTAAPWASAGIKTKVTFCAADITASSRELIVVVELVTALVDVWVPLVATAASVATVEVDAALVELPFPAEGGEIEDDAAGDDDDGTSCAAAGLSVIPSSSLVCHVGRTTPVTSLNRNV